MAGLAFAVAVTAGCRFETDFRPDWAGFRDSTDLAASDAPAQPDIADPAPDFGGPPFDVPTGDAARDAHDARDAGPAGDTPAPNDVPADLRDGAGPADGHASDAAPADAAPDWPVPLYCPYGPQSVAVSTRSTVYRDNDFANASDWVMLPARPCPGERPPSGLERVFAAAVSESGTWLGVQTRCTFECQVWIARDDCTYTDLVGCFNAAGDERVQLEAPPGMYYVFVEPALDEPPAIFDLVLALSRTTGRAPCPVEASLYHSAALQGGCETDGALTVEATADTSGLADRHYLVCPEQGVARDRLGGAPDAAFAIVADYPDAAPRTVDIEVEASGFEPIVALSAAPCGAAEAILGCFAHEADRWWYSAVTLFPGETLYAIVDGNGEQLLPGTAAGAVRVRAHFHEPGCPSAAPRASVP